MRNSIPHRSSPMLFATAALLALVPSLSHADFDPGFVGNWKSVSVQCSDREQEGEMLQGARLSAEMVVKADGTAVYRIHGEKPNAAPKDYSFAFTLTSDGK